jgi:hypothetical protein
MPTSRPAPHASASASASQSIKLEYVGFHNAPDRREYVLRARSGEDVWEHTVWIAYSAFAAGRALLQDGPDICYQKLRRELAQADVTTGACVGVTDADLASYRAAHPGPPRRFSSPPSAPAKPAARSSDPWMSASSPAAGGRE